MNSKFSIIVPVYRTEKYLARCVNSLLAQTLSDIEVILVDDGSPDGSGPVCDGFASRDPRVRVIHKKNEGQGLARNAGLELASGEYVLFVDSDDYIEADTCGRLFSYMKEKEVQLCSFGYIIEDPSGKEVYRPGISERVYRNEEIRNAFVHHFFGDSSEQDDLRGVSACMTAFQRKVIESHQIRFPSERQVLSEDTVFSLEFCRHINGAAVLPAFFYHYVQNENSFSHAYRPDRYPLTLRLCGILEEYARQYGILEEVQGRINRVMWVSLMECLKQEVRREDAGRRQKMQNVRILCRKTGVQKAVWALEPSDFGLKQRALLAAVRHRWTAAIWFLTEIRNRRGL